VTALLSPDELEAALRAIGEERYHIHHPFHHLLHGGKLTKAQVQAWALNRYYYQASIPAEGRDAARAAADAGAAPRMAPPPGGP
jgi:coenzyme PQQ biosynthesis protein C